MVSTFVKLAMLNWSIIKELLLEIFTKNIFPAFQEAA